jgi:hypothetical protein
VNLFCEFFYDIYWHSTIHMVFLVVPFQGNPSLPNLLQCHVFLFVVHQINVLGDVF